MIHFPSMSTYMSLPGHPRAFASSQSISRVLPPRRPVFPTLSSLVQICTMSLRLLLTMENLYVSEDLHSPPDCKDDIVKTEWLDLLQL